MELVKKQIHANQVGKKMVDQFLVDDDYNVPDMKNDVHRIITSEGIVKIEDVRKVENYVRVTGKLNFQILYVTEGIEPSLSSMEGKIPFEEMVYTDEGTDGEFVVQDTRVDFTTTMIHSRKLNIKAMIELLVSSRRGDYSGWGKRDTNLQKAKGDGAFNASYGEKGYISD